MFFTRKRISTTALVLILICFIAICLTGCELETLIDAVTPEVITAQSEHSYYIGSEPVNIKTVEKSSGRYLTLSNSQKLIYSIALQTLRDGETTFTCRNADYDAFFNEYGRALIALFHDYPEFFWTTGQATANAEFLEGSIIGNVTVELEVYDYWKSEDLEKAKAECEHAIKDIVTQASKLSTDYEKIKFVHDFIIQNTAYDYDSYNANGNISAEAKATTRSVYGPLVQRKALCSGYARTFELIMQRLGIEASCVEGTAGGDPHAWNVVKIDGEYYYIDLTWDDADGNPCDIVYHYFCLPERDISKTHTLNREFGTVTAISNKYNYYIQEGCYLQEYSSKAVQSIIANAENKDIISIRFADIIELNKAHADLVTSKNIWKIADLSQFERYTYVINEELCVLTFLFEQSDESISNETQN